MKIVLDGNDGTGKSTLCETLKKQGFDVVDRGFPTKMSDDRTLRPGAEQAGEVYVILDAPVEVCRKRLGAAGKDLNEKYHTVGDLTFYRDAFRRVAFDLQIPLIDSSGPREETLARVLAFIEAFGSPPTKSPMHPELPAAAKPDLECPEGESCGFNRNNRELQAAHERPLILESTRSHGGEDSWRDMDGYDNDEELSRLRRAVLEVRRMNPQGFKRHEPWRIVASHLNEGAETEVVNVGGTAGRLSHLLAFIGEAFTNIDDNLRRMGDLPKAWMGSSSVRERPEGTSGVDEPYMATFGKAGSAGDGVDEPRE